MKATRDLISGLSLLMLSALPASSENIQLEQLHGIYMVPVRINDTVTVPFVLDSGASEVSIPEDVFSVLRRARTISQSDFIGTGTYTLAGGATVSSERYILHRVTVGNHVITDVVANVASVKGDPLLGQSFLSKLPGWSIDNAQHVLVLHDEAGSRGLPQSGERPTSGPSPETASHAVPMPPPPSSPPPPANADVVSSGASAYENGDYPTAMTTLLPAAQTGDPTAQYYVGLMYLKGQGILKVIAHRGTPQVW